MTAQTPIAGGSQAGRGKCAVCGAAIRPHNATGCCHRSARCIRGYMRQYRRNRKLAAQAIIAGDSRALPSLCRVCGGCWTRSTLQICQRTPECKRAYNCTRKRAKWAARKAAGIRERERGEGWQPTWAQARGYFRRRYPGLSQGRCNAAAMRLCAVVAWRALQARMGLLGLARQLSARVFGRWCADYELAGGDALIDYRGARPGRRISVPGEAWCGMLRDVASGQTVRQIHEKLAEALRKRGLRVPTPRTVEGWVAPFKALAVVRGDEHREAPADD
jgi:hypothetical protein